MSEAIARLNAALEGRYRIESELGEGGMATVYLAEDIKHGRKVALKVLKPELAAVVGAERFLAEIKTTANLQHPHILPLFDSGEADSYVFYVMPYVEGESLRDRLDREHQLPVDDAVALASKVAGALQHAHEHGIIHRDIKPGNILLQDGEPVVADFGIALAVGAAGSNRLTETGLSLGTPYYMSPEQATGDQAVGASTDTYALGSVLYEMLVGEPPYGGSTAQAVLGKIISGKPVSAMEERPTVSANVDAAIRKALEKLPADRFTSAQEFVRALGDEHFRYGEAVAGLAGADSGLWKRLSIGLATLAAVSTIGFGWWIWFGGGLRSASVERSIAVLPFDDLSPEGDQQYFADGLSEEIIYALTQIAGLNVAARTSTFLLAEQGADIATVASTLGVANVLEGSVRKSGDRLRITAQLIEAESGFHLWSETFDRELTDIFEIQDAIARAIAERLQVTVMAGDQTPLARHGTEDLEAYELTLQGRFHANQLSQEALEQAIDYFDQAIIRDPRYAPAYAGKAFAYGNLSALEYLPPLVAMPETKAAARRAIQLDNSLSAAHTWLGFAYLFFDWDWTAAEQELVTALELNPNSAEAHLVYTAYLASQGRMDEAVSHVRRAQEIDPKSIMVYAGGSGTQWTFLMARRYAESIEEGRRAVDLDPENSFAHAHLGLALVENGVFGEGITELEKATRLEDAPMLKAFLAYGYAEAGRESDARALLSEVEEISRERYTCAYEIAVVHLSLGDEDAAIEWLDKAFEDSAACIPLLNVDPRLDNLRDDPRFQELLDRVGFESSAVRAEIIGV